MRQRSKSLYIERSSIVDSLVENTEKEKPVDEWNTENDMRLVRQIWQQLPKNDNLPYDEQLKNVKWKEIFIYGRKPTELKERFENISKKIRKYRLLGEILKDIEKQTMDLIHLPEKPVTAFTLFMEENKDKLKEKTKNYKTAGMFSKLASKLFNELPDNEKEVYKKKAEDMKQQYNEAVSKYTLESKEQKKKSKNEPLSFYWEHKKQKNPKVTYNDAKKDFYNMSKDHKLKWLLKWLQVKPNEKLSLEQYLLAKQVLAKDQMKLIDMYESRPIKMNAYACFLKDFIASFKGEKKLPLPQIFKEATKQWNCMSLDDKLEYTNVSKKIEKEYAKFIETLPEDRQKYELGKATKRKTRKKESGGDDILDNSASTTPKKTVIKTKSKNNKTTNDGNVDQVNHDIQTQNDSENDDNQTKKKKKKLKKIKEENNKNTETTLQSPSSPVSPQQSSMTVIGDFNVLSSNVEKKSPKKEKSRSKSKGEVKNVELLSDVVNNVKVVTDELKPLNNVEKTSSEKKSYKKQTNQKNYVIQTDHLDQLEESKNDIIGILKKSPLPSLSASAATTPSPLLRSRKRKNSDQKDDDNAKLKSNKKTKINKLPPKPPGSAYKYYVLNIYKGPMNKAKISYKSLSAARKSTIERKYAKIKEKFLNDIKKIGETLTNEERKELSKFYSSSMDDEISDLTETDSSDSE